MCDEAECRFQETSMDVSFVFSNIAGNLSAQVNDVSRMRSGVCGIVSNQLELDRKLSDEESKFKYMFET